jgi:hypothetical protein
LHFRQIVASNFAVRQFGDVKEWALFAVLAAIVGVKQRSPLPPKS